MSITLPRVRLVDLVNQVTKKPVSLIGRDQELERMSQILHRHQHNNLVITGAPGVGKTALITGYVSRSVATPSAVSALPYLQISTAQLTELCHSQHEAMVVVDYLDSAFATLPPAVVVIDDVDSLMMAINNDWQFITIVKAFVQRPDLRLILSCKRERWQALLAAYPSYLKSFSTLELKEVDQATCHEIIRAQAPYFSARYQVTIAPAVLPKIVETATRLPAERVLPDRALQFFDELCAAAAFRQQSSITTHDISTMITRHQGQVPLQDAADRHEKLRHLAATIRSRVHGQDAAVDTIVRAIQAGLLGLKDPTRPRGAFLCLGPSGVGKTELAKAVAQTVFGSEQALVRLDMSEFSEPHTVQRLLGAPPGYVGYEEGGQLTEAIRQKPYSLVLLDEIEKAHPSLFDIFLQVFDDGRLTDNQGVTIDFTHTIIIATSNIGAATIVESYKKQHDIQAAAWQAQYVQPLLLQRFRPEFLNRFTDVLIFEPLSPATLLAIAHSEIAKLQNRLGDQGVQLTVSDDWLKPHIERLYNPLFGARPLKRFLEEVCEQRVIQQLL